MVIGDNGASIESEEVQETGPAEQNSGPLRLALTRLAAGGGFGARVMEKKEPRRVRGCQ